MTSIFYSNSTHHVTLKISHTECQKFWILASQCDLHRHRLRVFQFLINEENAENVCDFLYVKCFCVSVRSPKRVTHVSLIPNAMWDHSRAVKSCLMQIQSKYTQNTVRIQSEYSQKKNTIQTGNCTIYLFETHQKCQQH